MCDNFVNDGRFFPRASFLLVMDFFLFLSAQSEGNCVIQPPVSVPSLPMSIHSSCNLIDELFILIRFDKFTTNVYVCFYFRNSQRLNDSNGPNEFCGGRRICGIVYEIQSLCLFPDLKFDFYIEYARIRIRIANRNQIKTNKAQSHCEEIEMKCNFLSEKIEK